MGRRGRRDVDGVGRKGREENEKGNNAQGTTERGGRRGGGSMSAFVISTNIIRCHVFLKQSHQFCLTTIALEACTTSSISFALYKMSTRPATSAHALQGGGTSSAVTPQLSGRNEATCVVAGLPTPSDCQHDSDSTSESGSGCEGTHPIKAWKFRRFDKQASIQYEICDRPCFRGGFLREPVYIETKKISGTVMMLISSRAPWISAAATGKGLTRGAFTQGVCAVKTRLTKAVDIAAVAAHIANKAAASTGRDILGLSDDDSDSSKSSEGSGIDRKPGVVNPMARTLLDIEYNGITFKARARRNQLYVEARAAVAETIVAACLDEMLAIVKADTMPDVAAPSIASELDTVHEERVPAETRRPVFTGVANPTGKKKIRFDDTNKRYEIMYTPKDGDKLSMRRSVKGLGVKTCYKGVKRTQEEFAKAMDAALREAKKLWNELDGSDAERFVDL
jgi:hypothetical protein